MVTSRSSRLMNLKGLTLSLGVWRSKEYIWGRAVLRAWRMASWVALISLYTPQKRQGVFLRMREMMREWRPRWRTCRTEQADYRNRKEMQQTWSQFE